MEGEANTIYSVTPPSDYNAIKNMLKTKNVATDLSVGSITYAAECGGFFLKGDTRENLCNITVDITSKTAKCTSFTTNSMICECCGTFMGKSANEFGRQTFVVSDQCFPAALPSGGAGKCVKIYRMEGVTILDLVREFLADTAGWHWHPGSLILLGSASHLANVGLAAYTDDYHQATQIIGARLGKKVYVRPAPMILLGGTKDKQFIRSLVELSAWLNIAHEKEDGFPREAISMSLTGIAESGVGGPQPLCVSKYRLYSSIAASTKSIWISQDLANLPDAVLPFSECIERKIISALIVYLNDTMALELDPNPNHTRMVGNRHPACSTIFVIVGSSHAGKTAAALRELNQEVVEVTFPAWRPTAVQIEAIKVKVSNALESLPRNRRTCVIYQLFDNCLYYARCEDGSLIPARKGQDGRFHVDGESVLAPKEMQYRTFKQLLPVLELAGGNGSIIVPPLPRYWKAACCGDPDHIPNLRQEDYQKELETSVYESKSNLKDFAFRHGLRGCKVISAWPAIKKTPDCWDSDPIHPSKEAYVNLAKLLVNEEGVLNKKRAASEADGPPTKRPRTAQASSNQNSDTRSHGNTGGQQYRDQWQGGPSNRWQWGRGNRGSRGCYGGNGGRRGRF